MSSDVGSQGVAKCYIFKSRLQEYAQKVGLATPVYETIKEGPSHEPNFRSTVIVNEVRYDSLPGFFNRKAAEQSAAEVALVALASNREAAECISQPVHETGLCKNLLQEYAQKMNYAIPSYECQKSDVHGRVPHFICTVDIGGIKYIGAAARTKKEAEIKAARTALLAIQSSVSGPNGSDNTTYTVVPCKKKAADMGLTPKTAPALNPQKRRFKKKPRKRRHPGRERNLAQNGVVTTGNIPDQTPGCNGNEGGNFVADGGSVLFNNGQDQISSFNCNGTGEGDGVSEKGQLVAFPQSEMSVSDFGITSTPETDGSNFQVGNVDSILSNGQVVIFHGEVPTGLD